MLVIGGLALVGCFPFEEAYARCEAAGRCFDTVPDGGGAGVGVDAGADLELAWWPVPPEAPSQYLLQGDAVVLDQRTGLAWQRGWAAASSWADAAAQCQHLNTAGFGGVFFGWRLPTAIELLSIVDSTALTPAVNTTAFPGTPSVRFWSASFGSPDAGLAWAVGFGQGEARPIEVGLDAGVRCLRSGDIAVPGPRFTWSLDGGAVRDEATGLTWQAQPVPDAVPRVAAAAACAALSLGGADGGWRLPLKKELETLVDRRGGGSTIDAAPFSTTLAGGFWSATPVRNDEILFPPPAATWTVDFSNGSSTGTPDTFSRRVRCVR